MWNAVLVEPIALVLTVAEAAAAANEEELDETATGVALEL
jgi:hypothetical protein